MKKIIRLINTNMAFSSPQTLAQIRYIKHLLSSSILYDKKAKEVWGDTDLDTFVNHKRTVWEASELVKLLKEMDNEATDELCFMLKCEIEKIKPIPANKSV